ncbi:dehydrogenase [Streptomyces roseofulvus]
MEWKGYVLCLREEDEERVCRSLWRCPDRVLWWHWVDRQGEPLERCPIPQLVR